MTDVAASTLLILQWQTVTNLSTVVNGDTSVDRQSAKVKSCSCSTANWDCMGIILRYVILSSNLFPPKKDASFIYLIRHIQRILTNRNGATTYRTYITRHTGRMSSKRHAISTEITIERRATELGPTQSKLFFLSSFVFLVAKSRRTFPLPQADRVQRNRSKMSYSVTVVFLILAILDPDVRLGKSVCYASIR